MRHGQASGNISSPCGSAAGRAEGICSGKKPSYSAQQGGNAMQLTEGWTSEGSAQSTRTCVRIQLTSAWVQTSSATQCHIHAALSRVQPPQVSGTAPETRNCTVVGSRPVPPVGMTPVATTVAPLFAVMRTERGPGEGATGTSQSAPNLLQRMRRFVSGLPAAVRSSSLMNSHCNSTANSGRRRSQAGRILVWQESGRRSVGSMSSGLDT